ncbi:MAG TPA: histidine kinase [Albitalea sp.]|nr:histidine kinase [Albitalea sp.]
MQVPLETSDLAPRRVLAGFAVAWLAFWVLMVLVGVQDNLRNGGHDPWRPIVSEGSSMLVSTAVVVLVLRLTRRLDVLLDKPTRWFARVLAWLPPLALGFVAATYGLRHAAYAIAGSQYRHEPWGEVIVYESLRFAIFYALFTAVHFGLRSYVAWSGERERAQRHETLSRQAQLAQLTQQLQPHFLFNALNTVSALIHTDPQLADRLLTRLATLLRAATDAARRPEQSLADELTLLRAYAEIMVERFSDRVSLDWQIDAGALACIVPTLSLQPLLENCFRHAVEPRRVPTHIVVQARRDGATLKMAIDDDGGVLGASPRFGVGLSNLKLRLEALHGAAAQLRLQPRESGPGVSVSLELPCGC